MARDMRTTETPPVVTVKDAPHAVQDRSIGELFGDLSRETTTLIRQEVALAKAEVREKVPKIGRDVAFIAVGGMLAYAGLLALVATAIIALAYAIPWWLSALIIGVVVIAIGGALAMSGVNALKRQDLAPKQTVETLKEDVEWAKTQTK